MLEGPAGDSWLKAPTVQGQVVVPGLTRVTPEVPGPFRAAPSTAQGIEVLPGVEQQGLHLSPCPFSLALCFRLGATPGCAQGLPLALCSRIPPAGIIAGTRI